MNAPRVLGLDLSLTCTGIASSAGWWDTVGRDKVTTLPLDQRLLAVDQLAKRIAVLAGHPDLVVVESPSFKSTRGGAVERHALWWLVVRALHRDEVPVAEVPPASLKRYATGKGGAAKTAVVDAVARRWPAFETGGNDNLADAVVLAAMGADHLGVPLAPVPAAHRAALAAVTWPEVR